MDFIFAELELGVEGITPGDVEIIDNGTILGIPVKMLGDETSISHIHLNNGNVFVNYLDTWVAW